MQPRPKMRSLQTGPRPLQLPKTQNPEEPTMPSSYQRARTRTSDHSTLSTAGAMPSEAYQYDKVYHALKNDEVFKKNWNVLGQERSCSEDSISSERATIRVLMDLKPHQKLYPTAYTPGFQTVPNSSAGGSARMEPEEIKGLPIGYSVALDVYILDDVRIMLKFQKRFRKDKSVDPEYAWLEKLIPEIDAMRREKANSKEETDHGWSLFGGGASSSEGKPAHVNSILGDEDDLANYPDQHQPEKQETGIISTIMCTLGLKTAHSEDGIVDGARYHIGLVADGTWLGEHIGEPFDLIMCICSKDKLHPGKSDTRESFLFEKQSDGTYRIMVRSTGRYIRQDDDDGNVRITTRKVVDDEYGRFAFERQRDGRYRIRVSGSGLCLHGDESSGADRHKRNVLTARVDSYHDSNLRWVLEEERDGLISEMRKDERPEDALRPRVGTLPLDHKVAGWSEAVTPYTDEFGGGREHVQRHVALGKNQVYGECMLVNPFGNERGLPPREFGTWARKETSLSMPRVDEGAPDDAASMDLSALDRR